MGRETAGDGRQGHVVVEDIQGHSGGGVEDVMSPVVQEVQYCAKQAMAVVDLVVEEDRREHPRHLVLQEAVVQQKLVQESEEATAEAPGERILISHDRRPHQYLALSSSDTSDRGMKLTRSSQDSCLHVGD